MVRRRAKDDVPPDRSALLAERARLLARLEQLDRDLGAPPRETAVFTPPETR